MEEVLILELMFQLKDLPRFLLHGEGSDNSVKLIDGHLQSVAPKCASFLEITALLGQALSVHCVVHRAVNWGCINNLAKGCVNRKQAVLSGTSR